MAKWDTCPVCGEHPLDTDLEAFKKIGGPLFCINSHKILELPVRKFRPTSRRPQQPTASNEIKLKRTRYTPRPALSSFRPKRRHS